MVHSRFGRTLFGLLVLACVSALVMAGCQGGDTDGGGAANDTIGSQFVSDGGAGASLEIVVDDDLYVGDTVSFRVRAIDPMGNPLGYIRIKCETEHGLAILEPVAGGVAYEHTSANGVMSGVLGGLTPGSFIIECRAPQGFNLVARQTVRVLGDGIPDGFNGFPGATGGNLGGGAWVDPIDDVEDGIVASGFAVVEACGTTTTGPVDLHRIDDCILNDYYPDAEGNPTNNPIITPEPFIFNDAVITIVNTSGERVSFGTVNITIEDGRPARTTESLDTTQIVEPSETVSFRVPFTGFNDAGNKVLAGTSFELLVGTWDVEFSLHGESESGIPIVITGSTSLTMDWVDNCDCGD